MAINYNTVIEVNQKGFQYDENGGGFDSTISGGVDRTYGTYGFPSNLAGGGNTCVISGTTATLTGYTVVTGDAGNIINIVAGTGLTVGRYEIMSVSTVANTWTLDRSAGTGTVSTGFLGGPLATLGQAAALAALWQSNSLYCSGYETTTTSTANVSGGVVALTTVTNIFGYGTTRGDSGTYAFSIGSGLNGPAVTYSGSGALNFQCNNLTISAGTQTGISIDLPNSVSAQVVRDVVTVTTGTGITISNTPNLQIQGCEITSGATGTTVSLTNDTGYQVSSTSQIGNVQPVTMSDITGSGAFASTTTQTQGVGPYTYQFQRAPDVSGSPGTYANVGTGSTVTTYADSGLAENTKYWYRVYVTDTYFNSWTSEGVQITTGVTVGQTFNQTVTGVTTSPTLSSVITVTSIDLKGSVTITAPSGSAISCEILGATDGTSAAQALPCGLPFPFIAPANVATQFFFTLPGPMYSITFQFTALTAGTYSVIYGGTL